MKLIENNGLNIEVFNSFLDKGGEIEIPKRFEKVARQLASNHLSYNSFFDHNVFKCNFILKFV